MKNKKIHLTNKSREALSGYAFIALWLIGLIVFTIWPLGQALFYSLNEAQFKGGGIETSWTGLGNFIYAFSEDTQFPTMVVNYLSGIIVQVPFSIAAALIIAMLLNQKIVLRGFWRVIFFLPVIITSGPVMAELVGQGATSLPILSDANMLNFISEYLPGFIATPITMLFSNLIIVLWYTGVPVLIFLSGLQRINKSTYEAAEIDGASPWQTFWKITFPSMKPFILVNIIYAIVTLSFADIPASDGSKTILTYIQEHMISSSGRGYGYACALGIIYFLLILIQIGIYALLLKPRRQK